VRLQSELQRLWAGSEVHIRSCDECGFAFADPFRAGTPEIYTLITTGHEHYPGNRFEFDRTLEALAPSCGRILEIGAGDGAFLRKVHAEHRLASLAATEYDEGSASRLRAISGVTVYEADIQTIATTLPRGSFDAICMFQVLEHMDRIGGVFDAIDHLLAADGRVFISVPNPERTDIQEDATGLWDMPPNHIGRWSRGALDRALSRRDMHVVKHELEPETRVNAVWALAKYRFRARGYDPRSLAGRTDGILHRRLRGAVKRPMTLWDAAVLTVRLRGCTIPAETQWFQIART
jgi:SAM-dependent methyltransferase